MKKVKFLLKNITLVLVGAIAFSSCTKDTAPAETPAAAETPSLSMSEEFTDVSKLADKGWVIQNNSFPIGPSSWRQGLFTNSYNSKTGIVIGFPAYSAEVSPYDFISADATAVNGSGTVSSWLMTPTMQVKDGDVLSFWTRSTDDSQWPNYAKDRMQVRMNTVDGTADCGTAAADTGKFRKLVLDINPNLYTNDPGGSGGNTGYQRTWHQRAIVVSGFSPTPKATRFGFRYFMINGGINGANPNGVIGIDKLQFTSF
jgi:hypothetical protein